MTDWISVRDELPEIGDWIITVDFREENGMYNVFEYDGNEFYLYDYWMPLPEPPTETDKMKSELTQGIIQ